MSRSNRSDKIDPRTIQVIHAVSRTTRACWLLGDDPISGKNYDHRKDWIENLVVRFAAQFAIDVLSYSILSNHHHHLFRSRPDIVDTWDDTEVARRWMMICPKRKDEDGNPMQPTNAELDTIRNCPTKLEETRQRLSDVSWWMRLLNQRVAQRANKEDDAKGRFFEDRFKGIPVIDEETVLACAVYVDLNWIRACMAETLEMSDYTSAQRRIEALNSESQPDEESSDEGLTDESRSVEESSEKALASKETSNRHDRQPDSFLAPIDLCETKKLPGPQPSSSGTRCSDKGFLPMSVEEYLELVDWSARQLAVGKRGRTPAESPPILERLGLSVTVWLELVANFDNLFTTIVGIPESIDKMRGKTTGRRFHVRAETRELFAWAA
ncbi:MAG: hypothetical protein KDB00_08510 [Planctomycetales bacterium]|nr:hypothetical protein [Planctomycetales bacterium]